MNDTTAAPQAITVLVSVTPADPAKYGKNAWRVQSVVDGEVDPYWTVETPQTAGSREVLAAQLHLARIHTQHRVSRIGRAAEEADLQAEVDDYGLRAYRAELRLIAHS
jgi:hypothetical protein